MIRTKNSPPPPSHLRSARTYSGVSFREVSLVLKCSLDIYTNLPKVFVQTQISFHISHIYYLLKKVHTKCGFDKVIIIK